MNLKNLGLLGLILLNINCDNYKSRYPVIDPLKYEAISKREVNTRFFDSTAATNSAGNNKNISEIISSSEDHTLFFAALQAADLDNMLNNKTMYTIFAPTDAAFKKLPADQRNNLLKPSNKKALRAMLLNHFIKNAVVLHQTTDGTSLNSLGGKSYSINNKNGNLSINNIKILTADIKCSNGYLNYIDEVIL